MPDAEQEWDGLRAACRQFRVVRLAALVGALVGLAAAGAVLRCEPLYLSVAAYSLLVSGLLYGARPLLRLGLGAHSEELEPLATRVNPRASRFNMSALSQRVQRRWDAFAGLIGLILAFAGLTLSTFILPVVVTFECFAYCG